MPETKQGGVGVDAFGRAVVDPTANVIALNEASIKRIDDIRVIEQRLAEEKARRLEEVINLHERLAGERSTNHITIAQLRAEYQEKLSLAESRRIDAIRAVDVAAVATASDRASAQAQVLANQVSASAETLRSLVASTQSALATQLQQLSSGFSSQLSIAIGALTERIMQLEKAQYESKGKSGVADPILTETMNDMRRLMQARDATQGKHEGFNAVWVGFLGVAALLVAIAAIFLKR